MLGLILGLFFGHGIGLVKGLFLWLGFLVRVRFSFKVGIRCWCIGWCSDWVWVVRVSARVRIWFG